MFSNFRVAFIVGLAAFLLLFLLLRRWVAVLFATGLFLLNAWGLVPFYIKMEPTAPAGTPTLKVLQFNVRGGQNHDFERTIKVIDRERPDLIGISEITQTWDEKLKKSLREYPYRITEPHLGGIALFSKYPLKNEEVRYFDSIKRPRITGDIVISGRSIRIMMVHPVIPLVAARLRDRELELYAKEVKASGRMPVILFGDLNTTPWSFYFHKLLKDANLRDTEMGFGYHPTWPIGGKIPTFFPIDHCLTSSDFEVVDRRVLEAIGSDHHPVVVKLSFLPKSS